MADDTYHIPENEKKMDELYIALSSTGKEEGIVSMMTQTGHAPFVFGYKKMAEKLKPMLEEISKQNKIKIVIYKFVKAEVIEVIEEIK